MQEIPAARPDVVLVDVYLPKATGPECVRELKQLLPEAQFLMLTISEDYEIVFQALINGATGYLLKGASPARLLDAIKELHEGGSPMSASIARMVVQAFARAGRLARKTEPLTLREKEIVTLVATGRRQKEVAAELEISPRTVNAHLRQIYRKLQVRSKDEAIARILAAQAPVRSRFARRTSEGHLFGSCFATLADHPER